MKALITAGPTREAIDAARFISNRSSGRMGMALASVAVRRGHDVTLILGPVSVDPPAGAKVVRVVTADEMLRAVRKHISWCDTLIMAAAVADFRPRKAYSVKLKKARGVPVLRLERTPDVLAAIAPLKGRRILVGFAAETENLIEEGKRKLRDKRLNLIVANEIGRPDSGFESATNKAVIIDGEGRVDDLPLMSKKALASAVIRRVEREFDSRHSA